MPSTEFERLYSAVQDRNHYPDNLYDLLYMQASHYSARTSKLQGIESRVAETVWYLRKRMSEHEVERIVLSILEKLQPITQWVSESSSNSRRAEQVTTRAGPHSVCLGQLVTLNPELYQGRVFASTNTLRPDLFQRLVCGVLFENTKPNFTFLQMITLALMGEGDEDVADETEIREWIMNIFPFHGRRSEKKVALDIYNELTTDFESRNKVLESINPALRGRGFRYQQAQKGRVWRLPAGNEHQIFQDLYAPGHELLWNRPRPFLRTQDNPRVGRGVAINGIEQPAFPHFPKLAAMPTEILEKIGKHCALSFSTIIARMTTNHGSLEFDGIQLIQVAAESTTAEAVGIFVHLPRRRRERVLKRVDAMPLCPLRELDQVIRKQFLGTNHFSLKDSVHGANAFMVSGPYIGSLNMTYLPWEVINWLGTKDARLLTSVSIELHADALEELQWGLTDDYPPKVEEVLDFLQSSSNLRCLRAHIEWDGVGFLADGGIPHHKVFQMLSEFRGLQSVQIHGLKSYRQLRANLVRLMTS